MYIKELQLIGFKSFMERATLQFSPGLNAIIGPNGCGKSNILDALRWVLGEQAFSVLRCAKNEDLIFSGTATRPALNYAEVKLVLATADRPELGSEVEIRRRFFRSGESEYYLNRQPCRLRDISEVFLSAGIATKAYSIFDLRQIREIIAGNIRRLFEEAATLAKYQEAKVECQNKLSLTRTDLTRLDDIIAERERIVAGLKRQAAKLRAHQRLKEEEKELRLGELREQFRAAQADCARAQADEAALAAATEAQWAEVQRLEEALRSQRARRRTAQEEKDGLVKNARAQRQALTTLETQTLLDRQRVEFLTRQIDAARAEAAQLQQNLSQLQGLFDQTVARLAETNERLAKADQRLTAAQAATRKAEARLFELRRHELALRTQLQELTSQEPEIRVLTANCQLQIEAQTKDRAKKEQERAVLERRKRTAEQCPKGTEPCPLLSELSRDEERLLAEAAESEQQQAAAARQLAAAQAQLAELEARLQSTRHGLEKTQAEIEHAERQVKTELEQATQALNEKVELRQQLSRLETERGYTQRQLTEGQHRQAELATIVRSAEQEIQQLTEQIAAREEELAAGRATLAKTETAVEQFDVAVLTQAEEVLEANLTELRQAYEQNRELLLEQRLKCHQLQQQVNALVEEARTSYGTDITTLTEPPESGADQPSVSERLAQVRRRLNLLGEVNPLAGQEFAAEKRELDLLVQQRQDVVQAQLNLEQMMVEIDRHAREQFLATYHQVRSHFQEIFRTLFLEGEADLVLLNDQNPLESEIAIVAKPQGKNPKRLEQLSDGEKALLAVSLLFAFYRVKPALFCFLDEVDAPLDDVNVGRFANYLKGIAQNTQVIIITHNRATMERADVLFGVTAEEPGVSKLVSVNLTDYRPD